MPSPPVSRGHSLLTLAACVALCIGVGIGGAVVTAPEIATWYAILRKPSWTPPNWAFPVVWNMLYGLMGVAVWRLIVHAPAGQPRTSALMLFTLQLALNAVWSPVFFRLHLVGLALAIILALWGAILATILVSRPIDRSVPWLLAPYLAWVSYAITLNAGIWWLNG